MAQNIQTFAGDVVVPGTLRANLVTIQDPIFELGSNNYVDKATNTGYIINRFDSNANVAFYFDETNEQLRLAYTSKSAADKHIVIDEVNDLEINVFGFVSAYGFRGDGGLLSNLVTDLQSVTEYGASSDREITLSNGLALHATIGNVLVGGNVTASTFFGDGANLTGIAATLEEIIINGNVTSNVVELQNATSLITTGRVGVGNAAPHHLLSVGANVFVDDVASNVLTVEGNVRAHQLNLGSVEILPAYSLGQVTNISNATFQTLILSNAHTAFVTTAKAGFGIEPASADVGASGVHVDGHLRLGGAAGNTDDELMYIKSAGALGVLANHSGTNNTNTELRLQTGDTNNSNITMVGKSSAQYMTFGTNAVERMRITNTGNVGIGTNNPAYTLDVHGTSNVGALTATTGTFSSNLAVNTDDFFVDTVNSRVGVGTTNPAYTLDVAGASRIRTTLHEHHLGTTSTTNHILFAPVNNNGTNVGNNGSRVIGKFMYRRGSTTEFNRTTELYVHHSQGYTNGIQHYNIDTLYGVRTLRKVTYGGNDYWAFAHENGTALDSAQLYFTGDFYDQTGLLSAPILVADSELTDITSQTNTIGRIAGDFVVGDTGNVGIGTASPTASLHVHNGNIRVDKTGECIIENKNDSSDFGTLTLTSGYRGQSQRPKIQIHGWKGAATVNGDNIITFHTNGSERMKINQDGNVGIGTASPGVKLHLVGVGTGSGPKLRFETLNNGNPQYTVSGTEIGGIQFGADDLAWVTQHMSSEIVGIQDEPNYSGARGILAFKTSTTQGSNPTEKMRILANGNVGIGTTNPSATLHLTNQGGTFNLGGSLRNQYNSLGVTAASITAGYNTGSGPTNNGDGSYTWTKGGGDTNGAIAIGFIGAPHEQLKITFTAKTTDTTSPSFRYENPTFISLYSNTLNTTYTTYTFYVTLPATPINNLNYFRVYADDITWNALTVERADVFTGGNVGIGTTNPIGVLSVIRDTVVEGVTTYQRGMFYKDGKLQITPPDLFSGYPLEGDFLTTTRYTSAGTTDYTGTALGVDFDGTTATSLYFKTASDATTCTEKMRIMGNGKVGIGTTNPRTTLEVYGGFLGSTNSTLYSHNLYYDTAWKYAGAGYGGSTIRMIDSEVQFWNAPNDNATADSAATVTQRMTIAENGNVGIGTANPSHQLTTTGRVRIGSALSFLGDSAQHIKCMKYFPYAGHWLVATGNYSGGAWQWMSIKAVAARLDSAPREMRVNIRATSGLFNVYDVQVVGNDAGYNNELLVFKKTSDSTYYVYASIDSASTWTFDITHRNSTIDETGSTFVAGALDTTGLTEMSNTATGSDFSLINGKVGIGTTNPGGPLDVVASAEGDYIARFKNNSTSGDQDARIVIETSDADGEAQLLFQTTDESTTHKWSFVAGSGVTPNLQFQYNSDFNGGTHAMTIEHGGNVGIGAASPAYKLEVNGKCRAASGFSTYEFSQSLEKQTWTNLFDYRSTLFAYGQTYISGSDYGISTSGHATFFVRTDTGSYQVDLTTLNSAGIDFRISGDYVQAIWNSYLSGPRTMYFRYTVLNNRRT